MRKLNRNDKVVITCTDAREKFDIQLATVVTVGKKFVTVKLESGLSLHQTVFHIDSCYNLENMLIGGCKDGTCCKYCLWDFDTVEKYLYYMNDCTKRDEIMKDVLKLVSSQDIIRRFTFNDAISIHNAIMDILNKKK